MTQCPECASQRIWKDGLRYTKDGDVQRWLCRNCGFRFSGIKQDSIPELQIKKNIVPQAVEKFNSRPNFAEVSVRQVGFAAKKTLYDSAFPFSEDVGSHTSPYGSTVGKDINAFASTTVNTKYASGKRAKNLVATAQTKQRDAGVTTLPKDTKSLLFEFAWYMKREGLRESTIEPRIRLLRVLVKRGVNLLEPESVKDGIARQETWCEGRKANGVNVYTTFLKMIGRKWHPPTYKRIKKLPFIPNETELDQLIAGCGRRTATFLQVLKETGVRCGESWRLRWTDIDFQNKIVTITPEKGSDPRQFKVSLKLVAMLNALPRRDARIWKAKLKTIRRSFQRSRSRIAEVTKNPRLRRISFHTFRHWKAMMEYHKTKDLLHVMRMLGHRNINNTLRYTQLIKTEDDEFISKVAKTVEEACALVEAGYEYVTEFRNEEIKVFRKRK